MGIRPGPASGVRQGVREGVETSRQERALEHTDRPEVAVPPLDRVLLDEAVAPEELHAVGADLHALARALQPGERRRPGGRRAAIDAARGAKHEQAHAL